MPTQDYIHGASDQTPDDQKLGELIIYIAQRSEGDEKFAATKLNKLLFFSDFLHYRMYGRSITGQEYQKLVHGPAPRRLMPVQRTLKENRIMAPALAQQTEAVIMHHLQAVTGGKDITVK